MKTNKKLISTTLLALVASPLLTVSCSNSPTYNQVEFINDVNLKFKEELRVIDNTTSTLKKLNVKTTGDIEIFWKATGAVPAAGNWKSQKSIRNASFWAFSDFVKEAAIDHGTTAIINNSQDLSVLHQKINAQSTAANATLPDFLIVSDADVFNFMKYRFEGKDIFSNADLSENNLKAFTTQPFINITNFTLLNEVFKLQARERNESSFKILNSNGEVVESTDTTANVDINMVIRSGKQQTFNSSYVSADEYVSNANAIYKMTQLLDNVQWTTTKAENPKNYGVGFDFPGQQLLDILKTNSSPTIDSNGITLQNSEKLNSFLSSIGAGSVIKMEGDNNYNTGYFSTNEIIMDITKGFSYNYIKTNPNLTIVPLNGFETQDSRYLLSFDSRNVERETLKNKIINSIVNPAQKVQGDLLSSTSQIYDNGIASGDEVLRGTTEEVTFDIYYSLWSKSRATNQASRTTLSNPEFYTDAIKAQYALDDKDVNMLISMNKIGDIASFSFEKLKFDTTLAKSMDFYTRMIMSDK